MTASDSSAAPADLSNCDREPIHIPGTIQDYGLLLVVDPADLCVVQHSANAARRFGMADDELAGRALSTLFDAAQCAALADALSDDRLVENPSYLFRLDGGDGAALDLSAHRYDGRLLLELEPAQRVSPNQPEHYALLKQSMNRLQRADGLRDLCQYAAEEVRRLSGVDRAMVYRFADDGSGWVFAESCRDDWTPYLDLHYPASDIPQQARALYLRNALRLIADVNSTPVPIVPARHPRDGRPADLSFCALRSVSPLHIEYLQNMGVAASLSISLVKNGELWGLIACHHGTSLAPSYAARAACEYLGQAVSLLLDDKETNEDYRYRLGLSSVFDRLTAGMTIDTDIAEQLLRGDVTLRDYIDADGVAVCTGGGISVGGHAPGEADLQSLVDWLTQRPGDGVFATDSLPAVYPRAAAFPGVACGLLAAPVSRRGGDFILWFRAETAQTVTWGGDPNKPVTLGPSGERLTPRKSFEAWSEQVRLRSLPWKKVEIEAAERLRLAVIVVVVDQVAALSRLNDELRRSNEELDAFAYVASHDLKEPLRGIHGYAHYLLEDLQQQVDERSRQRLSSVVRLTQRMETLIDSLLHYSRVGRTELTLEQVDLDEVLSDALELLEPRRAERRVEVRRPRPLPTLRCDRQRLREVFTHLLSNAIKYNDKTDGWVEIGAIESAADGADRPGLQEAGRFPVLYVRDNGIGMRPRHLERIFTLFKRLHGRDEFGGGTGIGLTVAKKIVERHGGRIWLVSEYGAGTTFYFTLDAAG